MQDVCIISYPSKSHHQHNIVPIWYLTYIKFVRAWYSNHYHICTDMVPGPSSQHIIKMQVKCNAVIRLQVMLEDNHRCPFHKLSQSQESLSLYKKIIVYPNFLLKVTFKPYFFSFIFVWFILDIYNNKNAPLF